MPALADACDATGRASRADAVLTMVQSRLHPPAAWRQSSRTPAGPVGLSPTPYPGSSGVLRYDARGFAGPDSERELDTCLAVMSTSDAPWTFSVWDHLGGEVLRAQLERRGFVVVSASTRRVWLDLPATVPVPRPAPGAQLRRVVTARDGRDWAAVHGQVFGATLRRAVAGRPGPVVRLTRWPSAAGARSAW